MAGYGSIPKPSGKPKNPSVYPYGQGGEQIGRDRSKSREINKGKGVFKGGKK